MTPTPEAFSRLDLYTVLHSLPSGVSLANSEGKIVFSNQTADRILGMSGDPAASPDEWADHYGVFLPDGKTPFPTDQYPLVRALKGEEVRDVEMLIRNPTHPDGVRISASGQQLFDVDGTPIGASVVFRDITELRRIELLKDELAAFIVHDLKSPLTTIIGTCDLIAMEHDNESLLKDLEAIQGAAQRVNRMVLDLLDIQMAEGGALEPERADLALDGVLREVEAAAIARIAHRDDHLIVVGDPGDLTVNADRELLFRTLMNLVDNCVKYGPQAGEIRIDAQPGRDGTVLFTVQDEGPGVPEHLRERIFEKYASVERDDTLRSRDSRGLGLRFCKVVADAHGGRIWVEDAEPMGARFCVELLVGG